MQHEPFDDEPLTPPPVSVAAVELGPRSQVAPSPATPRRSGIGWSAWAGVALALPIAAWMIKPAPAAAAAPSAPAKIAAVAAPVAPEAPAPVAAPDPVAAPVAPDVPAADRADAHVLRDGTYASIHGGVLFAPKTFASADGSYDLYIHFHGNTRVVLESVEHAGVNALVAIVNLGVGSGPYEDAYGMPGSYKSLLENIEHGAAQRGLASPHVRRIALGSWSAGYGAIGGILQQKGSYEHLDAIFSMDGIHAGYDPDDGGRVNRRNLAPFIGAAKMAARGDFLFSITHSEVVPEGYASSTETADMLLETVGGTRAPVDPSDAPEHVTIAAAKGAVSKKLEKNMEPTTEARVGSFHVRGYRGVSPEHHMAHLLQMAATVMPELAARWDR